MESRRERALTLDLGALALHGDLVEVASPKGLILFAHGSGSSRRSTRNRYVASMLQQRGFATLLLDLLTEAEDQAPSSRFDIARIAERLLEVAAWAGRDPGLRGLPLAYFGASTGAAAAVRAAAAPNAEVFAVVSRGGRPDLAMEWLPQVRAPTLLIVGGRDDAVLDLNRAALAALKCPKKLVIVPGATHLFEQRGALEAVARLASDWFEQQVARTPQKPDPVARVGM